jgi:hypothetical protein
MSRSNLVGEHFAGTSRIVPQASATPSQGNS